MLASNTWNLLGSLDFYMVVGVLLTFLQFALGVSKAFFYLSKEKKKSSNNFLYTKYRSQLLLVGPVIHLIVVLWLIYFFIRLLHQFWYGMFHFDWMGICKIVSLKFFVLVKQHSTWTFPVVDIDYIPTFAHNSGVKKGPSSLLIGLNSCREPEGVYGWIVLLMCSLLLLFINHFCLHLSHGTDVDLVKKVGRQFKSDKKSRNI